jgi:hypothetical protein
MPKVEVECRRKGFSRELDMFVTTPGEFFGLKVHCSKKDGDRVEGARYKATVEHCKKSDAETTFCKALPYRTALTRID